MSSSPAINETTALLCTLRMSPQGQDGNSVQVGSNVVHRAIQILVASQRAAQQNQPQAAPKVLQATAQQAITLPEGEYIGDIKDGVPHGKGSSDIPSQRRSLITNPR